MDRAVSDDATRDEAIRAHHSRSFTPESIVDARSRFHRYGFLKLRQIVPDDVRAEVIREVRRLLDLNAERRDLLLETTGNTPRFMSVVRSEVIAQNSSLLRSLYQSEPLLSLLGAIAGEQLYPCPSEDEEFLITRQERKGDTHGWHWGDYSFALIWVLESPPLEAGGMLQCVPHTEWNKANPRIHHYLCANSIDTYGFVSGDIYFLRTDTTLHRTVPLVSDAERIIVNLTWAAAKDLQRDVTPDDRWWENRNVARAVKVDEKAPS